ncbi:phage adaptor protein [Paenibacillus kobensis]|uniref:phage adaptor protein n=1 Tax=Paenibacillus kobensis TaxID=59841 RepID=UPI000FDA4BA5|nr:hypothetical protein [Paenibacillus kobensis]
MALTIAQIINEANERYPNGLTVESQLVKINEREKYLMRTKFRTKTSTIIDITAGQFLYPLEFSKNKIIWAIVNGRKYDYEEIDDDTAPPPFLYTYQNALGLYPTPPETVEGGILLYHYAEPKTYTLADMSEYPSFDPDFHMIHVFGLCADMAEIDQAFDVANGYLARSEGLLDDYKKANAEPELPPIRVV